MFIKQKTIFLESERLFLRELTLNDWPEVHNYASQEIVCQYQPWGPNTKEDSQEFVSQVVTESMQQPRTKFAFAVILKSENKLIGGGELNIRDFTNECGEIGYIVHPDYWGIGIATEVAKLLIDYGFNQHHLHRIYATCDPRNIASSKVLEKIGMTREGLIRDDLKMKVGWRDSLLYSILKQEWVKR